MHYSELKPHDVANGTGVRVSLFCSGCEHACPGCFNPQAWQFSYGKPFTDETAAQVIELMRPKHIRGLTLLGGEPLHPRNRAAVLSLLVQVRQQFPRGEVETGKDIWCYTGYVFEELLADEGAHAVLAQIDVLVDGRFMQSRKSLNTRFRGSDNQRVLDCNASLRTGRAVEIFQ
ncbi:MAG: anaerobic ribonucleoside-triphosphate reductase activating protein [Oscillospiraceae bacterium]|nr:anaerobic ribonucleoside-triphosphate reductase activating protein [Oscillospiraceae bacterium]